MYTVAKEGTRVAITDWKGAVVYAAEDDAIIVYESYGATITARVGTLSDEELVVALTSAVRLRV